MGLLAKVAIVAALFFSGFASGSLATQGKATNAALSAQKELFDQLRESDKKEMQTYVDQTASAMLSRDLTDEAIREFQATSRQLIESLRDAPQTFDCVNSPVNQLYYDSLRNIQTGNNN